MNPIKMPGPALLGCVLGCALIGAPVMAQVESLTLGQATNGVVEIDSKRNGPAFVSFTFDVEDDVLALAIELEAAADLDLYLDTEYVDDYQDVLASSTGYSGSEILKLDFSRDPEQVSPVYHIDVAYGRAEPPLTADGEDILEIPFTVKVTPYRRRVDARLEPGRIVSGNIDPKGGGPYRNYVIEIPSGTPALRIDLASDASDLDLRVRRAKPMRGLVDAEVVAVSWAGHETIVIDDARGSIPSGTYYIDVFDQSWLDWPAEFNLVAAFDDRPPLGLIDLPMLSRGVGLDGAVNATVEVLHADGGGTGVFVSESGYILTNYHVVSQVIEAAASTAEKPLIGLTVEPSEGSRVRFHASIVGYDKDRDMALLQVDSNIYGEPLPAGYRFPAITRGDPGALTLGATLWVLGYPDAGSLGTRVSPTLTLGIVSGFERRGTTRLIKTDADIAAGNSGGPVLNERHELIGLATETISEQFGNSQIGYIFPIWLVPPEWWAIVDQTL
jgi:S1-C subfamily serine protease